MNDGRNASPARSSPRLFRVLRGAAMDITPLRESRDFSLLFSGQLVNLIGSQVRMVTVPYLVFILTRHSSFAVGMVSLAQFVPALFMSIVGGQLADILDRRQVLIYTQVCLAVTSGMLTAAAFIGTPRLWYIFVVVAIASAIGAIDQPTRRAVVPRLVARNQIANALAINQAMMQISVVIGPSLAGVVLATLGIGPALLIDTLTFLVALATLLFMTPLPPLDIGIERKRGLAAIGEGLSFIKERPPVFSTFLIDLNATFFGGPRALFPALALDVFRVGQTGLGVLYAAPGAGALTASLLTGWISRVRYQGRAVVIAVCVWGAAITAFGLVTRWFWLALILIAIAYGADAISAIFRATILQLAVPDRLRGRLSAIHFLVVSSGPQLGNVESGTLAELTTPQIAVASGGILSAIGAVIIGLAIPAFMRYDTADVPEGESIEE